MRLIISQIEKLRADDLLGFDVRKKLKLKAYRTRNRHFRSIVNFTFFGLNGFKVLVVYTRYVEGKKIQIKWMDKCQGSRYQSKI
ncbi:hypothetical protein P8452_63481 [Trifolium repens]|nr:hypothetical protein P8452_63481 [Trifolium repens]